MSDYQPAFEPIVVMGVAGSGKSTLGRALALALQRRFIEGDTLHPPANIAKMAAGTPLDDADRQPYLERVANLCAEPGSPGVVVSCSALKRRYRDIIRAQVREVTFVLPMLDRGALSRRLLNRRGHFMPASLLDSQLATLELPGPDEHAILIDGALGTDEQVARIIEVLKPDT